MPSFTRLTQINPRGPIIGRPVLQLTSPHLALRVLLSFRERKIVSDVSMPKIDKAVLLAAERSTRMLEPLVIPSPVEESLIIDLTALASEWNERCLDLLDMTENENR